jgi:hypothetical protein
MKKFIVFYLMIFFFAVINCVNAEVNDNPLWKDILHSNISQQGPRYIIPESYRLLSLNFTELKSFLNSAPLEENISPQNSNIILKLPYPDGSFKSFRISESPIMAPALALQFPDIKTYNGKGIDDPYASVRFDVSPLGFHAQVLSSGYAVYIDPFSMNDKEHYISYFNNELTNSASRFFRCDFEKIESNRNRQKDLNHGPLNVASGEQLRTYRLVVGATGEYTAFYGGTVTGAMAGIVNTVNRVNGIYERDVAVRMVLQPQNVLIVYTNPNTDPYTNDDGEAMLSQNQTTCDNVIGPSNYDIGHVFSTGGGGVAYLGVVCINGAKAGGVTGSPAPVGDPFDIDYVAHEMGHQYGADHTFNSTSLYCAGNRNGSDAYEPGSGSTIMAYAGICQPNNLQNNSDPYFHRISLDEIISYTTSGGGNSCPVTTATGNTAPVVNAGLTGLTIPISTPITLRGSASDTPGDALTYCWEEWDLGPSGNVSSPSGNAPIIRSFNPSSDSTRTIPRLISLLNNTTTFGEMLPSYSRLLSFRLTVRDNRTGGGGVTGSTPVTFTVTNSAGPFIVTAPNTLVTWNTNSTQTVTWNVANTSAAPVNSPNVNIKLSTDGGLTYPLSLASNTPNDGSENITVPVIPTTSNARVRVESANNIFFDISNTNFTVNNNVGIVNYNNVIPEKFELAQNYPNPFNPVTRINFALPKTSNILLRVFNITGSVVGVLVNNEVMQAGTYAFEFDGSGLSSGIYYYKLEAGNNIDTKKMILLK